MTWCCLRECRAQAEGRGSSAAANPKCQLPDPGEPVIAPRRRKMQVITHAEVTLPVGMAVLSCTAAVLSWAGLHGLRGPVRQSRPPGRVHQLALPHLDDRFRK